MPLPTDFQTISARQGYDEYAIDVPNGTLIAENGTALVVVASYPEDKDYSVELIQDGETLERLSLTSLPYAKAVALALLGATV